MYALDLFRKLEKRQRGQAPRLLSPQLLDAIGLLTKELGVTLPAHCVRKPDSLNGLLNKLSPETYREIAPLIRSSLSPATYEELYGTLQSNSFYAALYADLCAGLTQEHLGFNDLLQAKLAAVDLRSLTDAQRAQTALFAQLGKRGVVPNTTVAAMGQALVALVTEGWDDAANRDALIEWAEHLFILVTADPALHRPLAERVAAVAAALPRQHAGFSNKTAFRFMDISDRFAPAGKPF